MIFVILRWRCLLVEGCFFLGFKRDLYVIIKVIDEKRVKGRILGFLIWKVDSIR